MNMRCLNSAGVRKIFDDREILSILPVTYSIHLKGSTDYRVGFVFELG